MRLIAWSLIGLALLAAPLVMRLSEHWDAVGGRIVRALDEGALGAPEDGPLTLVEKAVVVAEFENTWRRPGRPCRTLDPAAFGRFLAGGDDRRLPGRSVSQALAGTSVFAGNERARSLEGSAVGHYEGVLMSCQLERRYTDKQLLRMWLPLARFEDDVVGLSDAAATYFGKEADELDLEQAARLAALLRNPGYYREQEEIWAERARRIAEGVEARGAGLE
jgi:membrane carboxypeptidase/penicillin-binding protein